MFRHNLLIAFRNFKRHKGSFFLNLVGLSVGLASSFLIFLWVENEFNYDRFNEHFDSIYRVISTVKGQKAPLAGAPLAAAMKAEMPEVENVARVRSTFGAVTLFEVGERKFEEKSVFYADPAFFRIFSFPLAEGDASNALSGPHDLLMTERMAKKYFGSGSAIGKILRMNNADNFTVTGILRDIPENSHLQFDFLLPMSNRTYTDDDIIHNRWENLGFYTYVQLQNKSKAEAGALSSLESRIDRIYKQADPSFDASFQLQPLSRAHLYSTDYILDMEGHGNIQYVRIFSIIAIFVLLVACINFMNLTTARSARRAKEVGLRKVIGAGRGQLVSQFLGESFMLTFFALLLSIILVFIALPAFNHALGKTLSVNLGNGRLLLGLLAIFLVTSMVSGSYPAFFLASFHPAKVLKGGKAKPGHGSILFRNGLVVLQFVVSIVLIVGTVVIYDQLRFIQHKNLGYDKENLLYLPLKGDMGRKIPLLRTELGSKSSLEEYSIVSELPINPIVGTVGVNWEGKAPDALPMFSIIGVDENFLKVFNMQLIAGRGFSREFGDDSVNFIINEKALHIMGFNPETAVGKPISVWGNKGVIIGVVKDFNFKPVQQPIEPLVMLGSNTRHGYAVVRSRPGGASEAIAELKGIWQRLNPSYDFEYGFVDQELARRYESEQRMGVFFNSAAFLAIFISCLGLTGLASFIAEQRTKEIGIRKVLGAPISSILVLLSRNFVRLVIVAFFIATPLAWYGMSKWLEAYTYRIGLAWWIFGGAGLLTLFITLCTISFQSVKAAMMKPVKSIRVD